MSHLIYVGDGREDMRPAKGFVDGTLNGTIETASIAAYPREKYEYTNTSRVVYIGYNRDASATTADTDWTVIKHVYDANTETANLIDRQILPGSWDNRASLAWDI
jgi:hypothetical protein